jgi:hypothetical protein
MAVYWEEEGLALPSTMVTDFPQDCVTLAGTLPGPSLLVSHGKDLSRRRPQVGASHWEPGLSLGSEAPHTDQDTNSSRPTLLPVC